MSKMIINMVFDELMKLVANLQLQLFYTESEESFSIFALLNSHVIQTEIRVSDITAGTENPVLALGMFRQRYLSQAFKPISVEGEGKIEKLLATTAGGAGTAGTALIPVSVGSKKQYRCPKCGRIGEETFCPICHTTCERMKEAEMTIRKWVGFDFEQDMTYIIRFLNQYGFDLITDVTEKERNKIRGLLISSMTEGWTIPMLTEKLENLLEDKQKAEAIARTETIRSANEGAILHYKDKGIEKVRFIATPCGPKGRTCEKCLAMNGKEFYLKEAEGLIPLHPLCRCCWSGITT